MFWITDKTLFHKEKQNASRGYFTLVQNPTKGELGQGIYKPRLTMTKRFNTTGKRGVTLDIELSAPKLLFHNNYDELRDGDISVFVEKLRLVLVQMGIKAFSQTLLNAPISAIHYSKNIPLSDGTTPHYLIDKIKQANVTLAMDVNQTDYRNDGHSFKWHSNSYEVAFYDKLKDLEMASKSEKRAVEDDSAIQLNLFETLKIRERFEVLRMEVRLNKRQKIRQLFSKLSIQTELTLKNLFSTTIAQQVLLHYLGEVESRRLPLFDYRQTSSTSLLADLIINNPNIGVRKTIQLFGLKRALDNSTPRELRSMFGKYGQRSWFRLIAEVKKIKLPTSRSPLGIIREHLTDFVPLKLIDFQGTMLNNDKFK